MSIKKIAELTGTSVSTVSRVLNNPKHRCHDKNLEEKIWQAATNLHYTPNSYARNLRKGKPETEEPYIVDIFLTRFDSMDKDSFFKELFECIKDELMENHCVLGEILTAADVMTLGQENQTAIHIPYRSSMTVNDKKNNTSLALISEKKNTGLIILGKCPANLVSILKKRYLCIAGIDRNPTNYEYDEVVCNGATAAETAMEYLFSLGHTNIAYIGDCSYESRYIGYCQALIKHNLSLNHANVHPTSQTSEEGCETMRNIIMSQEKPTAVFCANDSTAIGALKALGTSTKKNYIPSIISIDNIMESEKTSPMLTTINIPKQEMGHLALSLLLDRKNEKHKEAVRIELPCRLIIRDSCFICV